MFKNNNILAGIIAGSILPIISLFIFSYLLKGNFVLFNKPGIPYLVAVTINLFITRYCYKKGVNKTGSGVMLVTFVFLIAIFVFKLQPIK